MGSAGRFTVSSCGGTLVGVRAAGGGHCWLCPGTAGNRKGTRLEHMFHHLRYFFVLEELQRLLGDRLLVSTRHPQPLGAHSISRRKALCCLPSCGDPNDSALSELSPYPPYPYTRATMRTTQNPCGHAVCPSIMRSNASSR